MKLEKGIPAYQYFYPNFPYKAIPNAIKEVAGKSPGRNIVVGMFLHNQCIIESY